ncbi:MAG: DUF2207 domain-containing protein [Chitinophagales bacterium]|nr:DUF2207 domain-containing protein [Chitinophagales bacterium]
MIRILQVFILVSIGWIYGHTQDTAPKTPPGIDRIISFHSDVKVGIRGGLSVTETIKVFKSPDRTDGQIERGITREFPTKYKTPLGGYTEVPFRFIGVVKNGRVEKWKSEDVSNGVRLYFGDQNIILNPGIYVYTIQYTTAKQLIYHQEKDELFWNVNGAGWKLGAEEVSCTITFPDSARIIKDYCYTGQQGSKNSKCTSALVSNNVITFKTKERLEPLETMSISATIEKGVLIPEQIQIVNPMDYIVFLIVIGSVFLILIVNIYNWWKVGRDPKKGTIVPNFSPPKGFSPADCGFLHNPKFTNKLFTSALVDMAVNKMLKIDIIKDNSETQIEAYKFSKPDDEVSNELIDSRFEWYGFKPDELYGLLLVKNEFNSNFAEINKKFVSNVKKRLTEVGNEDKTKQVLYRTNNSKIDFGCVTIIVVAIILGFYSEMSGMGEIILVLYFAFLLIGAFFQFLFARWLPAYSEEGRKVLDEILGFKMYLSAAESYFMNLMNPPEKSLQLFEKYLPYAIALECDFKWTYKFQGIIDTAIKKEENHDFFLFSDDNNFDINTFSSNLNDSFSYTISSASTLPSSSDGGSDGGGSAGGGGGGGGGGGW